jgi:hypothetical protein
MLADQIGIDEVVSTIAPFDGSAITKFDVLPASASRLL